MSIERNLTELEGTVLGIICVKGPCTPYLIRKDFKQSLSVYWNGSAGAIYPLIERLARQKLIKHASTENNARGGKLYILTKSGEKALRTWLYEPVSPVVIGIPPDPLRNRIEILGFLEPEIRKSFLDQVALELENQLEILIRNCEEAKKTDCFKYCSLRGAVLNMQARLNWIREIKEVLI